MFNLAHKALIRHQIKHQQMYTKLLKKELAVSEGLDKLHRAWMLDDYINLRRYLEKLRREPSALGRAPQDNALVKGWLVAATNAECCAENMASSELCWTRYGIDHLYIDTISKLNQQCGAPEINEVLRATTSLLFKFVKARLRGAFDFNLQVFGSALNKIWSTSSDLDASVQLVRVANNSSEWFPEASFVISKLNYFIEDFDNGPTPQ